jgi:predicted amidohydrolase YtcJ
LVPRSDSNFEQALSAYTQSGANLSGWGEELGSISVGKWADFVLLDSTLGNPVSRELKKRKSPLLILQEYWSSPSLKKANFQVIS